MMRTKVDDYISQSTPICIPVLPIVRAAIEAIDKRQLQDAKAYLELIVKALDEPAQP